MGTNLQNFNSALSNAAEKIKKEDLVKFIRSVCLETFKRVVQRTPVDTGRARGNWQVEINAPAAGTIEADQWASVFERGDAMLASIPPFSVVHITNNVEYVFYLEYVRRSKQAPNGFVEITLQEMTVWLSSVK
jgi:hypothetical protein